ncbi:MAG: FlgD immunoglobulin-like domain containing protein [bacterium]
MFSLYRVNSVAIQSHVQIKIYNTVGQLIRTLVDEQKSAGEHQVIWSGLDKHGHNVASRPSSCSLETEERTIITKRMLLLKVMKRL